MDQPTFVQTLEYGDGFKLEHFISSDELKFVNFIKLDDLVKLFSHTKTINIFNVGDIQFSNNCEIIFISHRWIGNNPFSTVLFNELQIYLSSYGNKYKEKEIYLWIDYYCVNQNNIQPYIKLIPKIVKLCNNFIMFRYKNDQYYDRLWCNIEWMSAFCFRYKLTLLKNYKVKDIIVDNQNLIFRICSGKILKEKQDDFEFYNPDLFDKISRNDNEKQILKLLERVKVVLDNVSKIETFHCSKQEDYDILVKIFKEEIANWKDYNIVKELANYIHEINT